MSEQVDGVTRTSPVDPSLSAATTERTHGVQGQHVAAHTPGPWVCKESRINDRVNIVAASLLGEVVAQVPFDVLSGFGQMRANAARIVACVNACEGVSDPAAMVQAFRKEIEIARAMLSRVAELEAALRDMRDRFHAACLAHGSDAWAADAACAKADALLSTTKGADK